MLLHSRKESTVKLEQITVNFTDKAFDDFSFAVDDSFFKAYFP